MNRIMIIFLTGIFVLAVLWSLQEVWFWPDDDVTPRVEIASEPSVARHDVIFEKATVAFPSGYIMTAAVADTDIERAQGLSYRPFPQSMLFVFDVPTQPSFWMKDMNFSIDIIWVRGGQVVGIVENAEPEQPATKFYTSDVPIDMALEVPTGTVKEAGLHLGDALDITWLKR